MSQMLDGNYKAFPAGGALGKFLHVKFTAGVLSIAATTEEFVGITMHEVFAAGEPVLVRLRSAAGTAKAVAAGAFSQGAVLYVVGTAGQVDDVASTNLRTGIALESALAAGDIVEILCGNP